MQVAVDELAEAPAVLNGPISRPSSHEEFKLWQAEGVLQVDGKEPYSDSVLRRGPDPMVVSPNRSLSRTFLVRHRPELPDLVRIEVRRNG